MLRQNLRQEASLNLACAREFLFLLREGGVTAFHSLFEKFVFRLQLALHFLHRISNDARSHRYHHDDLPALAKEFPIRPNVGTRPAQQANRNKRARETYGHQSGEIQHPVPRERAIVVKARRESLEEVHQIPDRQNANSHEQDRSAWNRHREESRDQHPDKDHTLFYFEKLPQTGEPNGFPRICAERQARLHKKRHLNAVEGECQQTPQGVKSQTILEQLWHVATAMDNGNDLQRRCSRPVDNQVGVDWEGLHPFIRQILAPMPSARVCPKKSDPLAND